MPTKSEAKKSNSISSSKPKKNHAERPPQMNRKSPIGIKKKSSKPDGIDRMLGFQDTSETPKKEEVQTSSVKIKSESKAPAPHQEKQIEDIVGEAEKIPDRISVSFRCREDYIDKFLDLFDELSPQKRAEARKKKKELKQGQKAFTKSDLFEEAILLLLEKHRKKTIK